MGRPRGESGLELGVFGIILEFIRLCPFRIKIINGLGRGNEKKIGEIGNRLERNNEKKEEREMIQEMKNLITILRYGTNDTVGLGEGGELEILSIF